MYDAAKTTFAVRYRELVDLMGMDAFKRGVRRGIRRNGFRLRTHDVSDSESADIRSFPKQSAEISLGKDACWYVPFIYGDHDAEPTWGGGRKPDLLIHGAQAV